MPGYSQCFRRQRRPGQVAEWFNAPVLKTGVGKPTGGSNPSLAASKPYRRTVVSHLRPRRRPPVLVARGTHYGCSYPLFDRRSGFGGRSGSPRAGAWRGRSAPRFWTSARSTVTRSRRAGSDRANGTRAHPPGPRRAPSRSDTARKDRPTARRARCERRGSVRTRRHAEFADAER